jgi:hypothetical protein
MAGVLRVPLARFMLADALYAIPLVNLLFWLAYFLTDKVLEIFNKLNEYKPVVVLAVLSGIAGALVYKYILSRSVSTGEAPHVPNIIAKPAAVAAHAVEMVMEKAVETVTGRHHEKQPGEPPASHVPPIAIDSPARAPDKTPESQAETALEAPGSITHGPSAKGVTEKAEGETSAS